MDDLEKIKLCAKLLLHNIEPTANKEFPFIIYHPFISQNPAPYKDENGVLGFVDVFKDKDKLIKQIENYIDDAKSFQNILFMVSQPYQLLFFNLNKDSLSKQTYNDCLKSIWLLTEFPNADKNVSVNESLDLFKNANKNLIMSSKEKMKLKSLPDEVTIYRGTHKKNNSKALSWTDDYDRALWFAKRFDEYGYVLQATIKKNDIIAYFDERNENELIIDFNKIYNLKAEKIIDIKIQEGLNIFKEFQKQFEEKYSEELKNTGIFWAFSNQQFEDNKTHKDAPDNEYLAVFNGGYIHKSNSVKLDNFFKNIVPALKKEFTDNIKIEDLISYELNNHECYYTGDYSKVVDIIRDFYNMSENEIYQKVKNVYDSTLAKDVNDFDDYSNIGI